MTWSWAVNSAGECHVDIVEVGSSILPSPTKAYSIPDKELDRLFSSPNILKNRGGH